MVIAIFVALIATRESLFNPRDLGTAELISNRP